MAYPRQPTTLSFSLALPPLLSSSPKVFAAVSKPSRVHPDLLYRRNLASPLRLNRTVSSSSPLHDLHCHASLTFCPGWLSRFRNRWGKQRREKVKGGSLDNFLSLFLSLSFLLVFTINYLSRSTYSLVSFLSFDFQVFLELLQRFCFFKIDRFNFIYLLKKILSFLY